MKKFFLKIIVLLICIGLIGALVVKPSMKKISGSWKVELDLSAYLSEHVELLSDVPMATVKIPFILTFNADRTYTFELDQQAFAEALPEIWESVGTALTNHIQSKGAAKLEELLARINVNVDLDAMLSDRNLSLNQLMDLLFRITGLSFDDLLKKSISNETLTALFSSLKVEGNYLAAGGWLFLNTELGTGMEWKQYLRYKVDGDQLEIENAGLSYDFLPLLFSR